MTIVTRPITQDRKDDKDKEALVKSDVSIPVAGSEPEVEIEAGHERSGSRILSCVSHSCLLVTAIIALTVGVIGAFHVYRTLSSHHYLRGFCRLPYPRSQEETLITGDFGSHHLSQDEMDRFMDSVGPVDDDDSAEMMMSNRGRQGHHGRMGPHGMGSHEGMMARMMNANNNNNLRNGKVIADDGDTVEPLKTVVQPELVERLEVQTKVNQNGGLELDYELDLDLEEFESLQLPEISHGRYLHDFKVNKTAIIDPDGKRCFVMPLNRNEISPPRSLMEIISKLKNGAFELDLDEIRHDTRVVLPPLDSLEGYGFFIERGCMNYKTYRLEEVSSTKIMVKRSADRQPLQGFVEFGGKSMIKYNILNLDDIEN
jgi:hypothetical protein